ncbi:MAG: response regulator [Planctomycetota bacterium]|jgi:DNA-binding response OmpR family regulator
MKVLIAEDDSASRMTLRAILQKWGHEVVVAEDGNQAWELLQRENPKLAILDWMMPGIEGIELCRRIREKSDYDYIYVILLTAKVEKEDIVAGLDSGADDYITKPFDREVLRSRVAVGARIVQYETLLAEKNVQLQRFGSEMGKLAVLWGFYPQVLRTKSTIQQLSSQVIFKPWGSFMRIWNRFYVKEHNRTVKMWKN